MEDYKARLSNLSEADLWGGVPIETLAWREVENPSRSMPFAERTKLDSDSSAPLSFLHSIVKNGRKVTQKEFIRWEFRQKKLLESQSSERAAMDAQLQREWLTVRSMRVELASTGFAAATSFLLGSRIAAATDPAKSWLRNIRFFEDKLGMLRYSTPFPMACLVAGAYFASAFYWAAVVYGPASHRYELYSREARGLDAFIDNTKDVLFRGEMVKRKYNFETDVKMEKITLVTLDSVRKAREKMEKKLNEARNRQEEAAAQPAAA